MYNLTDMLDCQAVALHSTEQELHVNRRAEIEKEEEEIPVCKPRCDKEFNIRYHHLTVLIYIFQLCNEGCTILRICRAAEL